MSNTCRNKEVVTRKLHICESCKADIPVGSRVQNVNGIFFEDDGVPTNTFNLYFCSKCMEDAEIDEGEEAYKEHTDIYC
jgi:hypothetical protein